MAARLLDEQLGEGGWNCGKENGSLRSSFATTINILEGLLAHERATVARPNRSRLAGIVRNTSSNEHCSGARVLGIVDPAWLWFSFPTRWRYDVLRTLEYFRAAGAPPGSRMGEAIDLVRSEQQPDGTWLLENTHPGKVHFALEEADKWPSRWNTLRAVRVLDRCEKPAPWNAKQPPDEREADGFPVR